MNKALVSMSLTNPYTNSLKYQVFQSVHEHEEMCVCLSYLRCSESNQGFAHAR